MTRRGRDPEQLPAAAGDRPKPQFEIRFTPDAAADARALDGSIRAQLRNVLVKKLSADPVGYGLPLRGALTNFWKHQFANHRIIYRIYPAEKIVAICAVGIRKQGDVEDIYRRLEGVAKSGRLAGQLASVLKNLFPNK